MPKKEKVLALSRIALGFIFLWTFLDKTFGLGFSTNASRSWISGNSPTAGFLANGTEGPFADVFSGIAGSVFVDWLFMLGMLGIGLALVLGVGMTIATISGTAQMGLIYLSVFPPENNPFVDQHIIYILVLWMLYAYSAGDVYGLGKKWKSLDIVKKHTWLI